MEALKASIADPAVSIAALKKRQQLIDEGVERAGSSSSSTTPSSPTEVKQNGLGTVNPERMKQTIEMVAQTFKLPPLEATSIYRTDFMPPRRSYGCRKTARCGRWPRCIEIYIKP